MASLMTPIKKNLNIFRNSNTERNSQAGSDAGLGSLRQEVKDYLDHDAVPERLMNSFSLDLLVEPVQVPESGKVYSKKDIDKWFTQSNRDPLTNITTRRRFVADTQAQKELTAFCAALKKECTERGIAVPRNASAKTGSKTKERKLQVLTAIEIGLFAGLELVSVAVLPLTSCMFFTGHCDGYLYEAAQINGVPPALQATFPGISAIQAIARGRERPSAMFKALR